MNLLPSYRSLVAIAAAIGAVIPSTGLSDVLTQSGDSLPLRRFPEIAAPDDPLHSQLRLDYPHLSMSHAADYKTLAKTAVLKALDVYRDTPAIHLVRNIHLVRSISYEHRKAIGIYHIDEIYIGTENDGVLHSTTEFKQTFHHELSSILMHAYEHAVPHVQWRALNPKGFEYADTEENRDPTVSLDAATHGFICAYARDSFENDFNMIAENLFEPDEKFHSALILFPAVRAKALLALKFYYEIDPVFRERIRVDLPEAKEWP